MSVNEKMTAIAGDIRGINGTTGTLSLDAMHNQLGITQTEVNSQAVLIEELKGLLTGVTLPGEEIEINLQSKTVDPSDEIQIVEADAGYDGLEQVIVNAIPSSGGGETVDPSTILPTFTYDGQYNLKNDGIASDGTQNWRLRLLSSGTLNFTSVPSQIDVFVVGGGGGGATDYRAGGGGGGNTNLATGVSVTTGQNYTITVGTGGSAGGNGGNSSAFNTTANGGKGSKTEVYNAWVGGDGGSGGGGGAEYSAGAGGSDGENGAKGTDASNDATYSPGGAGGSGQGSTTREFHENGGTLYAGGGGGGGRSPSHFTGYGGEGGGGNGYNNTGGAATGAKAGATNTGGGGGGGYNTAGGKGGSGIVIIRNHRG